MPQPTREQFDAAARRVAETAPAGLSEEDFFALVDRELAGSAEPPVSAALEWMKQRNPEPEEGESSLLGGVLQALRPAAYPWEGDTKLDVLGNIGNLLIPSSVGAKVAQKAAPALGRPVTKAGEAMSQAGEALEAGSPVNKLLRHTAAAGTGFMLGGKGGAVGAAAADLALPAALRKGGDLTQRFGRWMRGASKLDDIPEGSRPRLVKNPEDPLSQALMGGSDELGDISVSLPDEPPMPKSGWIRNASGTRYYTSDLEAAAHRIPAMKDPPPAPKTLSDFPSSARPRLVKEPRDPLLDALSGLDDVTDAPQLSTLPDEFPLPKGGWVKNASGKRIFTSDLEEAAYRIPAMKDPPPPPKTLSDFPSSVRPRLVKEPRDPLLDALSGLDDAVDTPQLSTLPEEFPLPEGGWTKNAAGERVYSSDIAAGKHDIPARGTTPTKKSKGPSEPLKIGGQTIREDSPLYSKLAELMSSHGPSKTPIKPVASHAPTSPKPSSWSLEPTLPQTAAEWQEARRYYGTEKLAQLTGKTKEEIRRLAEGPSRLPLEAETRMMDNPPGFPRGGR